MKNIILSFKIAAVFIGTVVGAGLASGQEIFQFFTLYGAKGLIGISICTFIYILTGIITMEICYKYKAYSYKDLINLCCGKYLGFAINLLITIFLFGGICIILAGSGAIFYEYINLPKSIGIILMLLLTLITTLYSTKGLIFINSIIVPCMITIIITVSALTFLSLPSFNSMKYELLNAPCFKKNWLYSTMLYASFNMLFASGVLAPLAHDIKKSKGVNLGIVLGSLGLFLLSILIDMNLLLNEPHINNLSIPMLYIAKKSGKILGLFLSLSIWLEMFSTSVSDVYSLAQNISNSWNSSYKSTAILLIILAFPFSKLGFKNLICILYPVFGFISLIYILFLIIFYIKNKIKR